MSGIGLAIAACTLVGYAFFLGWWARGKALSDGERLVKILSRVTIQEIAEAPKREEKS